ncbi:hypothetical protein Malapachy_1250 [Malassezia pachydermatis]|uniref:NADH dehydrogenase [ubiquinone] 1 beta subcomplex subunit 2 n=1 Tax=Malassezia pachydermatis TaxID=77020 RepID=A0A0M8MR30_9BASI|nr:hypothetical protein Malapachy_1250 [Malassezia pachydermatis]KOS15107.1 hypothetical protein Malapachy_1250 [Malassezia pachydermatis]
MAGNGWFRPMHGFHPHRPAFRHRAAATLLGGAMWFWILVRAKEDGPVLLGWRHPWDHHGDAH